MNTNLNYQLGLLHFVHLLIYADGHMDSRELDAMIAIKNEEAINDDVFTDFEQRSIFLKEKEIYDQGVIFLNRCNEEEKLCVMVHLYRLAMADETLHVKEVRLLMYALKLTHHEFDDVVLGANLVEARVRGQA